MYSLLLYSDIYSDDLPIEGFIIMEDCKWVNYKINLVQNGIWPAMIFFGDSYGVKFESPQDYLSHISVKSIQESAFNAIKSLFNSDRYGYFPYLDFTKF